jgi:uncharacterized protein (DUF2384 family)
MAAVTPSITLDGLTEREVSSGDVIAVKAVVRVCKAWRALAPESARLAGVSERTWSRMKGEDWCGALSVDQKFRASAIVGLYKGLHLYFGDDLADKWPRMRNRGPLFQGDTPVEYMVKGGLPAILAVREYIDAVRGGL